MIATTLSGGPAPAHKGRILVVDDSPVVLETARIALEDAGYEVLTLDNPLSVAHVVNRAKPDLILLDVNMPAVSGDRVAAITRQCGVTNRTPMLLYSDLTEHELQVRATMCGAQGYIAKNGDDDQLVRQVNSWMARRSLAPSQ